MCYGASVTRKVSAAALTATRRAQHSWSLATMPDAASSYPSRLNGRHHPVYRRARDEAFARSRGVCQGCGQQPAVEVHHWALQYPPAHATTADDLIALCADCHRLTTSLRRFTWAGGSRYQLLAFFSEAVAKCDFNSPLPASRPSSCPNLAAGLDTRSPGSREIAEIAAKKGGNRTDVDRTSGSRSSSVSGPLYLGADGKPTLPPAALRAMIEAGARTVRQGPQVRGGLLIEPEVSFRYDVKRYGGTLKKLVETAQFTAPVLQARPAGGELPPHRRAVGPHRPVLRGVPRGARHGVGGPAEAQPLPGPRTASTPPTGELGRALKTEFVLQYMSEPQLRAKVRRGLLKVEQLHALARAVYYGQRGRISAREVYDQMNACSCLTFDSRLHCLLGRPGRSHGWPPRRTSRSTPICCGMSARSSGRTSSSTARSRSTPPSSRCDALSVYHNHEWCRYPHTLDIPVAGPPLLSSLPARFQPQGKFALNASGTPLRIRRAWAGRPSSSNALALPVPHNFSLDFMKPLRYGGEHGDSESGRAQPAGQPHPTASGAGRVGIAGHSRPRAGCRSRL